MLIKFFGGTGGGGGIANYLADPERTGREGSPPEVLSGEISRTRELIDSIDRKWTYSTGVISFAFEDRPTQNQQHALMADFERLAFAGLPRDRFDITWVRHSHTEMGRVELHFLSPRMDLATGKSFNIAPPGWERSYAPLRDAYNYEHGWARPDDPERSRTQQMVAEASARLQSRTAITEYLEQRIVAGEINNRADIVLSLKNEGFRISREGQSYITALDPENGERWRLKGHIYEKDWTRQGELDRAASRDNPAATDRSNKGDGARAAEAFRRLEAIIDRRAEWVRERYPGPALHNSSKGEIEKGGDLERPGRNSRESKEVDQDQRDNGGTDRVAVLGGTYTLDNMASSERHCGNQRDRNIPDLALAVGTGLAVWRSTLHKIGRLGDRESYDDRTGALARIRDLGGRIREAGESAFTAIRSLFYRDQRADKRADQTREPLAECQRSLEATKQVNERLDQENESIERRIEAVQKLHVHERSLERQDEPQMTR